MALHEEQARNKWWWPFTLRKVRKRDTLLENLMWIRNAPKLHLTEVVAVLRAAVLKLEDNLIANRHLDEASDIFHLTLEELDEALENRSVDLKGE